MPRPKTVPDPSTVYGVRLPDPMFAKALKRARREGIITGELDYGDRSRIIRAAVAAWVAPDKRGPRS